ncbi:DUF2797 domain-containing protein [Streptosporangium saharense]|uniref:DUF2797 domain-containing protein n=1 Tax=Streptosporangium saharense TaxID=1706840 RepID=UPI00369C706D
MTTQPPAWRSTGLHWESGTPTLTVLPLPGNPADGERGRPAGVGHRFGWQLVGPRGCIGVWTAGRRVPCPVGAAIPQGVDAQCPSCAAADRGRALARDAVLGEDGRNWLLYLAWFGRGLVKIGLTAADRGQDRLLEQGAICYSLLAAGPFTAIRRTEQGIAQAGLARERISSRAKADAWWTLPDEHERAEQVEKAHAAITAVAWPSSLTPVGRADVRDLAVVYGLDQPPPGTYAEVTGLDEHADQAVLAGTVHAVVGRHLLLNTSAGPVLTDMRRLAGFSLAAVDAQTRPVGLHTSPRARPRHRHEDHSPLF